MRPPSGSTASRRSTNAIGRARSLPAKALFRRTRQGVDERHLIDAALLRSAEARRLDGDSAGGRKEGS